MVRVRVVWSHLSVDARGVESSKGDVEEKGDDRKPEVHDDANQFREQHEEADDRYGDIEVCQSACCVSFAVPWCACTLAGKRICLR